MSTQAAGGIAVAPGAAAQSRGIDWSNVVLNAYILLFFVYLFAPLLVMSLAAFNAYDYPSVTQWRGWTLKWFDALAGDQRMIQGLLNSLVVALGVIGISLPLGLSGAFVLTRLQSRANTLLYAVLVSPLLMPGIILGISTLIFWKRFDVPGGLFLTVLAQASFIASYSMLLFMARLQRQDRDLEEAAQDLGASSLLLFRRITLPFLAPTIATAAVIAFLQSIENYNTTVFAIGGDWTLVTEIGSRFRFGLSPEINVIGVIFVAITIVAATLYVLFRKRELMAARAR
ncbi:spermidine/putrescine transport system permease protein [Tistlia consotensis]|uniref:Spermidine/putrescine transport system permease protein n=1 Tax=Tistlia consotensis USBA 355 TaxID=560819 RepID=A0A1Y6B7E7_9PROT|nr:ABC transporter permease [Tistlia consotensis]SME96976.1 spermidine/putrescine transport system permease protein [Tistlia consotensis USBA 355]SNR56386.1 spermidine/putrescine transport system permease protein [Tistlia consotensis]